MDDHLDETVHVISLDKFENIKKYKEQVLQEIIAAICAMLNSNGGKVGIHFDTESNDIPVVGYLFSQMSLVTRILEQSMISIIGESQTVSYIDFEVEESGIIISVGEADSLITNNYKLYLPSQTQVVEVSPLEPLKRIKRNIMNRKGVQKPVQLGSHPKMFLKDKNCGFHESKNCQLKNLKADPSKCITLADRMTGKGNKFSFYVSAFANHNGGHMYFGIRDDDGVVEGEFIPNEKDQDEIIKKVKKAINKLIWSAQIGQPKRGEHWEIFFEPVLDEDSKPIPSTFVIVIHIAPCLGGVFTEEPECYEMVKGEVSKMSFVTWKERISQPMWLRSKKKILHSAKRTTWSSPKVRKGLTDDNDELRKIISNGYWDAFSKKCESLQSKSNLHEHDQLKILYGKITACNRTGKFDEASSLLEEYLTISRQVPDTSISEVIGLYLQAALKRASGDFKALEELLTAALSKAELINPGLVTATVYVFAATVSDLINQDDPANKIDSPYVLSMKALKHLRCVQGHSDLVVDMKRKAHITLAIFHLGCNINGKIIQDNIDNASLVKAETSIKVIHESAYQENPLSLYFQIQINLVLSIFNYRRSQLSPNQGSRKEFLRIACGFVLEAKRRAKDYQFAELFKWSEANEDLCAKELERVYNADHARNNERDQRKDQCKRTYTDVHDRTEQQEGDHRESTEQRDHRDRSIQIAEKHTYRRGRTEQVERRDRTEQDSRLESSKEDSRSMGPEKVGAMFRHLFHF